MTLKEFSQKYLIPCIVCVLAVIGTIKLYRLYDEIYNERAALMQIIQLIKSGQIQVSPERKK